MAHRPQHSRRDVLKFGLGALGGFSLPNLLRLRAAAAAGNSAPETAVIFVQMAGGPSQFETYDPKPDAPAEYRGPMRPIHTSVPGTIISETLPRQAALMQHMTLIRSVYHREASHIAEHLIETGYYLQSSANALVGEMPSMGSIVYRVRGVAPGGLPGAVTLPRVHAYSSPLYLGGRYRAMHVQADPNADDFSMPNLTLINNLTVDRLEDRQTLLGHFDAGRRVLDLDNRAGELDQYRRQALELVTGDRAQRAFQIGREPAPLRDRYGRNIFGQRLLLARRLVEAGVPYVKVRTTDWDDHQDLVGRFNNRGAAFDQGVSTLIADLIDRGMHRNVLVVAMGEFGRTPRFNGMAGRDHWPSVMSVMLSGGSYRMGQVIGASDSNGARPAHAPYRPQNVLGMVYRHLGIDPATTFPDFTGRPRHILEERAPITELI